MIQLELTTDEEHYLREEVEKRLIELDHEIAHTDSTDFKDMLKLRRDSVRKFLEKLPNVAAVEKTVKQASPRFEKQTAVDKGAQG